MERNAITLRIELLGSKPNAIMQETMDVFNVDHDRWEAMDVHDFSEGYDADASLNPEDWLNMDEQERLLAIETNHHAIGDELPNTTMHATSHAIIETHNAGEV